MYIMVIEDKETPPQPNEVLEEVPGRDGTYDFSAANPSGRMTYKERNEEYTFVIVMPEGSTPQQLRAKHREILGWLAPHKGKRPLVLDVEPDKTFMATVSNIMPLEQLVALGEFPVTFRCDPFLYGAEVTTSKDCAVGNNTMAITNAGTIETPIIITVTGRTVGGVHTVNPLITLGSLSIKWLGTLQQGEVLTIDTDKLTVLKGIANALSGQTGSWLKVQPGINNLVYSDEGVNKGLVTIKHKARWL
jgi:predicted phage tail component-like protein